MGSPYLNSGETIVLTTSRVSTGDVPYDLMLTNERIFFIDNRNARFEPGITALSAILSVQAGKTPTGDPVITLQFRETGQGDPRQPLALVFSQDTGENRKPERDDWIRCLIQLSISQHEKEAEAGTPVMAEVPPETGLRPAVRHGVAPDRVRPLSNVGEPKKAAAPLTVIPEEVDANGGLPAHAAAAFPPAVRRSPQPEPSEEPAPGFDPVRGIPLRAPSPQARVIIPQIIEELLPVKTRAAHPAGEEQAPVSGRDFTDVPLQAADRSLKVTEEPAAEPPVADETAPAAVVPQPLPEDTRLPKTDPAPEPVSDTGPGISDAIIRPAPEPEEVPAIIRALHSGAIEPAPEMQPDAGVSDDVPAPVPGHMETSGLSESHVRFTIPEEVVQESATPAPEEPDSREEPAAEIQPPVRHPIPPAREIRPFPLNYGIAAVLILAIALAGAAVLLQVPGPGADDTPLTPAATMTPAISHPPATMPTTAPHPATTAITTAVPLTAPTVASIPREGVWVRVTSTARYAGRAGNAELLKTVSGTGDNFYKVLWDDRPVEAVVQKQDNSGAPLTVAVYRNGTLIASRTITSPMGTATLLIDPVTARPPGLPANVTPTVTPTTFRLENY